VEFINATRMIAGYTMGMEPSGRELLVIVVKGTFRLPQAGEEFKLHEAQLPLAMADTFTGGPGRSAPLCEADFAPRKAQCDVLLLGTAYAPGGRPAPRVPVGLRVGKMIKSFVVVGDRNWDAGVGGIGATPPAPFASKPISYDVAFGGVDQAHEDPMKHAAFMPNPIGRGFRKQLKAEWLNGLPLPNTEELDRPVTRPDEEYRPMAFGPIGRGWDPRFRYAGTYDEVWLDKYFPFLPPDFDERYYQAAPLDQQLPVPVGAVEVALVNLTPDGRRSFMLPDFEAPIHVFPKKGAREEYLATLDTVVFEPDLERFTMSWRLARPLNRNMFEIAQVLVGRKGREWWQQRASIAFPIPVVMEPVHPNPVEPPG
jgi:hypothetical protein